MEYQTLRNTRFILGEILELEEGKFKVYDVESYDDKLFYILFPLGEISGALPFCEESDLVKRLKKETKVND